jgi:glutamate-1-semialdehyde 2,1-aminomutase
MAAGIAQLSACLKPNFYIELESKTYYLINKILLLAKDSKVPFKFFSIGSIFWIAFTSAENIKSASDIDANSMLYFRQLHAYLLENGIYLGPSGYEVGFVSEAHTYEQLDKTAHAFARGILALTI